MMIIIALSQGLMIQSLNTATTLPPDRMITREFSHVRVRIFSNLEISNELSPQMEGGRIKHLLNSYRFLFVSFSLFDVHDIYTSIDK